MDDPGYADYQDYRLQPPDIDDDNNAETPVGAYQSCVHQYACRRMLKHLIDFDLLDPDDEEIADRLECEWCEEYVESAF